MDRDPQVDGGLLPARGVTPSATKIRPDRCPAGSVCPRPKEKPLSDTTSPKTIAAYGTLQLA